MRLCIQSLVILKMPRFLNNVRSNCIQRMLKKAKATHPIKLDGCIAIRCKDVEEWPLYSVEGIDIGR